MIVQPAATSIDLAFLERRKGELGAQMQVAKMRLQSLEAQVALAKSHIVGINGAMQENEHMIELATPPAAEALPPGGSPAEATNAGAPPAPAAVQESASSAEVPKETTA